MAKLQLTYTNLDSSFYSMIDQVPFSNIEVLHVNNSLSRELDLDDFVQSQDGMERLKGHVSNHPLVAQAYAGHQFGHFTMLGDGRAALIGEWMSSNGLVDLQLKGSGPTPYSRSGDGLATLQSMSREYLISEAMHHLGVPTTRSLALFKTGETVLRNQPHQGAMLVRTAASHIRVGTFEYARALDDISLLNQLADYTLKRHYTDYIDHPEPYLMMFNEVVKRQARLIAKWQSIGFVHGVMNTDNMTLSGETIDYGPCAFLDEYDPNAVFSSIDMNRRYAYFRQPFIASWNLSKLATALLPLIDTDVHKAVEKLNKALSQFEHHYAEAYRQEFTSKLGLLHPTKQDDILIDELLSLMNRSSADFTNTFAQLSKGDFENLPFTMIEWTLWRDKWFKRIEQDGSLADALTRMKQVNPVVIPRNHLVEEAVNQFDFDDDDSLFQQLLTLYENPFDYSADIDSKFTESNPSSKRFVSYCGT